MAWGIAASGGNKFRVGQRVRPSKHGQESCIFAKTRFNQTGVVTKVDEFNCPTVRWEGRKGASEYHQSFIAPDRRRFGIVHRRLKESIMHKVMPWLMWVLCGIALVLSTHTFMDQVP
jgi:hypothetical protein